MVQSNEMKLNALRKLTFDYYTEYGKNLLFHGWHHISFVVKKSIEFGKTINADLFLVESSALLHDLNYIVKPNSDPEVGESLRYQLLENAGYDENEIATIESIILESHTAYRGPNISLEGKALSDADSLFKILPITPIIFSSKYISQNQVDLVKLAKKIIREQNPLLREGIYFYTDSARQNYLRWAETNIELWNQVLECLDSDDVAEMLSIARSSGVI